MIRSPFADYNSQVRVAIEILNEDSQFDAYAYADSDSGVDDSCDTIVNLNVVPLETTLLKDNSNK